jgi:steroid delta-isomerase
MDEAEAAARRIYEEWHAGFNEGNLERIMAVYAEHAVIETPAVISNFPDAEEGILRGRDKIRDLFARNLKALTGTFTGLYRSGLFFSNGRYLTWEYPRVTPTATQVDLFESMDVENGLCVYHRVYWGWRGMKALLANRERILKGTAS